MSEPVCPFMEVVTSDDMRNLSPIHPTRAADEVRGLGITGLVMRRSPWWQTIPYTGDDVPRGQVVGITDEGRDYETANEVSGEFEAR